MKNNITIPAPGVAAINADDPETEAFKLAALRARVGNDSPFLKLRNKRTPEQIQTDLEQLAAQTTGQEEN